MPPILGNDLAGKRHVFFGIRSGHGRQILFVLPVDMIDVGSLLSPLIAGWRFRCGLRGPVVLRGARP